MINIVKPTYKYFKVTPSNSSRNQSTHKIARSISTLYEQLFRRVKFDNNKLVINIFEKVSYLVYIEKKKVEFYFIIPEKHETIITDKINDAWGNVTITEIEYDRLPKFNEKATSYQLQYAKEDALSIASDRRNNDLLRSNLNIIHALDENDRMCIYYNFIPTTQFTWKSKYNESMYKIKQNIPIERNKSNVSFLLKYSLSLLTNLLDTVVEQTVDKKPDLTSLLNKLNEHHQLSSATIKKENAVVIDTQILIISEAADKHSQQINARTLAQSFETISEDNRLIAKPYNKEIKFNNLRVNIPANKMSDMECQNFISLAGKELLEEYNFIDKIDTQETEVPEELREGHICIGTNTFRGNKQKAFLSADKEYKHLTLMLIGPTRAGKSTLIQNMTNDALNNNECVFMFDFIKNCELSNEVASLFPKDKVLIIECNNFSKIQGLGYNEVGHDPDPFKQYDNAKKQTTQLMALINSINNDETPLTAKMERYLTSAALIVFISNGSIKDVFDTLQDHNKRHKFIARVPQNQLINLTEYINYLYSLNEVGKEGEVIGSKLNLVAGIIDRLNKLKANTYMELMLKKGTEQNFNLVDEIQKAQLICLKMPEDMFSTDSERDIYTTYWITKLWLSLQMRARKYPDRNKHTKVNLIIDEIYQVNNTEKFLTEKLSRLAKFSVKPIISCHYIDQLKYMRNELRSANASYMLISGCDKNNYKEFKEELYPYEMDDLLNLKRYHSLNLIKHANGYGKFITKLPSPVK